MAIKEQELSLPIAELAPRDAGRGLARLSPVLLETLGVRAGGVLKLLGARVSAVRVLPAALEDREKGILLDALTRANLGLAVGDAVQITALKPSAGVAVVLEAHGLSPAISDLRTLLLDRVLTLGDRFRVDLYGAKPVEFTVKQLEPTETILLTDKTRIALEANASPVTVRTDSSAINYDDIGGLSKEVARVR